MTHWRTFEPLLPASRLIHGTALVVAPHPDDEVVGCGGLVVAHREAGETVHVVVMTDGGRGNPGGSGGADYQALRKEETRRALACVGGAEVHFLDYADGSLKDSARPAEDILRLLERHRPATLIAPSPWEVHPDHRAASLWGLRAASRWDGPLQVYLYEVGAFMPVNVLIDVTSWMLQKEQALAVYGSQLLHQDLVGKVRSLNRARTVNVDDPAVRYVEAYCRLESARIPEYLERVEAVLEVIDAMTPPIGSQPGPGA